MDVGVDSIGAVEFRNQVMCQLPWIALPAVMMFDYPSVREVCGFLMSKYGLSAPGKIGENGSALVSF